MRRETYHHGDLARALLAAARRLVEREGPAGASLRAVAREAGVTPAAPYHHYADRDALLVAVAARGFDELAETMSRSAQRQQRRVSLVRLQAAGVAYVRFAVRNPELFRLMFSRLLGDRSRYPDLDRSARGAFAVLERLLDGQAPSQARAGPSIIALTAWSTVHGLATLLIDGRLGAPPTERRAAQTAREVTRVLGVGLRDSV